MIASARAGNVIGGGDWSKDRLIPDLIKSATKDEPIEIRNPDAVRPWQHVLESLSGYLLLGQKLLEKKVFHATSYNFGPITSSGTSVGRLINLARNNWDKIQTTSSNDPNNPHKAKLLQLDISKARQELDWEPAWTEEESIEKTIDWYKSYYENGEIITLSQLQDYVKTARERAVMDKILITGATGYIGKVFLNKYNKSFQFYPVVRAQSNTQPLNRIVASDNLINAENDLSGQIARIKPKFLIHLASFAKYQHTSDDISPIINSNILFPLQILEAFATSGGQKILNIGSYWQHVNNSKYMPNSLYAASKQSFEDLIDYYISERNLACLTLKLFDTYGPNDPRKKIFNLVYESAKRGEALGLTGGKQILNLTHIDDVWREYSKGLKFQAICPHKIIINIS